MTFGKFYWKLSQKHSNCIDSKPLRATEQYGSSLLFSLGFKVFEILFLQIIFILLILSRLDVLMLVICRSYAVW